MITMAVAWHLDLLLDEQALDELAVPLPEPGMVHADTKLQRMPQVRVLRAEHYAFTDRLGFAS